MSGHKSCREECQGARDSFHFITDSEIERFLVEFSSGFDDAWFYTSFGKRGGCF